MIAQSMTVKNFRSIKEATITFTPLTALVGANGSGKSAFLRALDLFYSTPPQYSDEDFCGRDASAPIESTVTFTELSKDESELFGPYLDKGKLSVTRVLHAEKGKGTGKYYSTTQQCPAFKVVREAGGKKEVREKYDELRKTREYVDLPAVKKGDEALAAMDDWERKHPETLERMIDDGQFFGFTHVGRGYLGKWTRFLFVPAVRDASDDAIEGRGSAITSLFSMVVRSALDHREDLRKLKEDTRKTYDELTDPASLTELSGLETSLTKTLQNYYPDAAVGLRWIRGAEIELPTPTADVRIDDEGFSTPVTNVGHGLQRAFILALLQELTRASAADEATKEQEQTGGEEGSAKPKQGSQLPGLILAIEEPELYQHPSRQRHLARVLRDLAEGKIHGVAGRTQVLYSTHSPLFIGVDRFDEIRLVRKRVAGAGVPKQTTVVALNLNDVAKRLWKAHGKQQPMWTDDSLRPRLHIVSPEVAEGFFANVAVLVEGADD